MTKPFVIYVGHATNVQYQLYHVSKWLSILRLEMFFPFKHNIFQKTLWARTFSELFTQSSGNYKHFWRLFTVSRARMFSNVCSFPGISRENSINIYARTTSNFWAFSSGSIARVRLEDIKTQSSSITVDKKLNFAKQENNHFVLPLEIFNGNNSDKRDSCGFRLITIKSPTQ